MSDKIYIFDTTLRDGAQTQGVDFSLDDKEKIFYPFFTTNKEGKGIGLFMVKKLINHFNGLIFVDSDDTKTQFKIFLPI